MIAAAPPVAPGYRCGASNRCAGLSGLAGDAANTGIKIGATAGQIATPALAHLITAASWGVPVVGAAIAGVTLALTAIFNRKGPQQKVASTKIVNDLEPQLLANLNGYLNGPRTRSSQAAALANFDAAWAMLISSDYCGSSQLGNPGKACIADRQQGACVWKDASGQCWNWFVGYRDPIANDPNVKPDTVQSEISSFLPELTGGGALAGSGLPAWAIPAALVALAVAL